MIDTVGTVDALTSHSVESGTKLRVMLQGSRSG